MSESAKTKVLVVDDENDLAQLVASSFEDSGCETKVALNATEAILAFKEFQPQIVLSDVRMPGGASGFDLLKAIRQLKSDQVMALMTGFSDIPVQDMYHAGACDVFQKPFDRKKMSQKLLARLKPLKDQLSQSSGVVLGAQLNETLSSLESVESENKFRLGHLGFFIAQAVPQWEIGTPLAIKISFSQGNPKSIEGEGVVRWVRRTADSGPAGLGVELVHLEAGCLDPVGPLLDKLKNSYAIPRA
jgi:DNA-binding response OmpR family regulator